VDGGGGKIVLDRDGLRDSARRLRDARSELDLAASRLSQKADAVPVMPAGLGAAVAAGLGGVAAGLRVQSLRASATADDVDRRVLLAEVDDAAKAHTGLSGAKLALLLRELASGGVLQTVSRKEAWRIGQVLGKSLPHDRWDPKLLALAAFVEAHHLDPNFGPFAAGLVDGFGAANLPRLLTGIWEGAGSGERRDPNTGRVVTDLALVLAAATTSGMLSAEDQQALVSTTDRAALAVLVSSPHAYTHEFLVLMAQTSLMPGLKSDVGIPPPGYHDSATDLMLAALARNHRAAADFLAPPGAAIGDEDPLATLWKTPLRDGGVSLAAAYASATNYLQKQANYADRPGRPRVKTLSPAERDDLVRANTLTYVAIGQTLKHPIAPMTVALATDLAYHHMNDLVESAVNRTSLEGVGVLPTADNPRLTGLNLVSERNLLHTIAGQPEADNILGGSSVAYTANVIRTHTADPGSPPNLKWADPITAYHYVSMDAHDLSLQDHASATASQHEMVFKIIAAGANVVLDTTGAGEVPGVAITVDQGIAAIDHASAPAGVWDSIGNANGFANSSFQASIMDGYVSHEVIPIPRCAIEDGHRVSYAHLHAEFEKYSASKSPADQQHAQTIDTKIVAYDNWLNQENQHGLQDAVEKEMSKISPLITDALGH
jgi:hypothetical protein